MELHIFLFQNNQDCLKMKIYLMRKSCSKDSEWLIYEFVESSFAWKIMWEEAQSEELQDEQIYKSKTTQILLKVTGALP